MHTYLVMAMMESAGSWLPLEGAARAAAHAHSDADAHADSTTIVGLLHRPLVGGSCSSSMVGMGVVHRRMVVAMGMGMGMAMVRMGVVVGRSRGLQHLV